MTKNNQSVAKALQIIEIMAQANGPMRLQDISVRLGLPASTVIRFLGTLTEFHYVSQNQETLQYALTMKFCRLGHLVSSQVRIRDVARPHLVRLAERFGESASLAVEEERNVLYVDCVDGPDHILQTLQKIGRVAPMHSTGVGKLLLMNYTDSELEDYINVRGLDPSTKNTITSRQSLIRELKKIAKSDSAVDNEECEIGVKCVAAPLRDYTNRIVAAMSMSGPVSRMTEKKMEEIRQGLSAAAEQISVALGYVDNPETRPRMTAVNADSSRRNSKAQPAGRGSR